MSTKQMEPPTAEESQQAMDAGNYAYLVPRAEYEAMTARLERAERVVEAAREWKAAEDELRAFPPSLFEQGDHQYDSPFSGMLGRRFKAMNTFWELLAAYDAGAVS